jgi:hypothetical protein
MNLGHIENYDDEFVEITISLNELVFFCIFVLYLFNVIRYFWELIDR